MVVEADDGAGHHRDGAHGQTAEGFKLQVFELVIDEFANQMRSFRHERDHAAVEIEIAGFSGGELELAATV